MNDVADEKPYAIAFSRVPQVGAMRMQTLVHRYGSLKRAWHVGDAELTFSGLPAFVVDEIVRARPHIDPAAEMAALQRAGATALLPDDPDYPTNLRNAPAPPAVLYFQGSLLPADTLAIAVVGTRKPTRYGTDVARRLAGDLARAGVTIVSGLALGIDAAAHDAALQAGGRTLAVLGSGVDVVYPASHRLLAERIKDAGALLSEYPLGTKPDARNFPPRNRIISGLSRGVLVVEAGERSGALITAQFALDQNRDTFAVPGALTWPMSRGTNRLIQAGEAKLVLSAEDVLEELNLPLAVAQAEARVSVPLAGHEGQVLACLGDDPLHVDEVSRSSGLPMPVVSSTLAMLELKGLVRSTTGMNYVLLREASATYVTEQGPGLRQVEG
jgi:DNA processing protein